MPQTVLITGASSGIGKATAALFADRGWNVVATMRNPDDGTDLADLDNVLVTALDVLDSASIKAAVAAATERFGTIDVLVNNAGYGSYGPLEATPIETLRRQFDVNVFGVVETLRAVLPTMRAQRSGVIVNISSVSGHRPSPGTASYGAAKAGIDSLTQSLAVEWAPAVRVNSVVVGPVKTELAEMHYGDSEGIAAVDATIPMGRMADPRDVGQAAAFLASPLAAYITGAELLVHGGGEKPAFLSAANANTTS